MPYKPLTKADILRALNRLGELAQAKGLTLDVALYGGAVFTVVYGSRDSTKWRKPTTSSSPATRFPSRAA